MGTHEIPARIWSVTAQELEESGFDQDSIRAHAIAEFGEELRNIRTRLAKQEISATDYSVLEEEIRVRHKDNWSQYSAA